MAINQNHLFEELNGVKCSVVEKNARAERVDFLRGILEYNGYTVVVVPSPPAKAGGAAGVGAAGTPGAAGASPGSAGADPISAPTPPPETFTVGVTDVMFNPVNAIFGRLLKTEGGHIVTLAYWQGKGGEGEKRPYFEK